MGLIDFIWRRLPKSQHQRDEVDREIDALKSHMRQNAQIIQSGARVVENMSGAMRLIAEVRGAERSS